MMKKAICLACAVLLCGGAAFGGLLSEEPGELVVAGQFWLPGEGDSDLFDTGLGANVSYREWFSFPWGVGLNLGISQWQVDSGSQAYKWQRLTGYKGDALILAFGPALYFNIIDWDNWNLTFETGVQYAYVDSNVSVYSNAEGKEGRRDVDIGGAVMWHLGAEYEYMIAENLYLLAGGGYQMDLRPADTDYDLGNLRDTYLHGAFFRLGAKFLF
jgi:hypothetical protein